MCTDVCIAYLLKSANQLFVSNFMTNGRNNKFIIVWSFSLHHQQT
jgi:hypothetical protein